MTRERRLVRGLGALWLAGLVALGVGLGCGDALVGARCEAGYVACGQSCTDVSADYLNCGACGNDCGLFACVDGACSDVRRDRDAEIPEAPRSDASGPDRDRDAEVDPAEIDPEADAGVWIRGCDLGFAACPDGCADLSSDHEHCGHCDLACDADELCGGGACVARCEAQQTECGGGCVDLLRSPGHCGACGRVCASGICVDGQCADAVPGHVVVIGHNYERSNNFQSALLGNAVFLGRGAPVRTLVYEGEAYAASIRGVYAAIDSVADATGRAWEAIEAVESLVTLQLAAADVFVVHAQQPQSQSVLHKLGEGWGRALSTFVAQGGVVVLLDGPSPVNSGTFVVLASAGLFTAEGLDPVPLGSDLTVVSPGAGIAVRVGRRYRAETSTVGFSSPLPTADVVTRFDGLPVVIHKVHN